MTAGGLRRLFCWLVVFTHGCRCLRGFLRGLCRLLCWLAAFTDGCRCLCGLLCGLRKLLCWLAALTGWLRSLQAASSFPQYYYNLGFLANAILQTWGEYKAKV